MKVYSVVMVDKVDNEEFYVAYATTDAKVDKMIEALKNEYGDMYEYKIYHTYLDTLFLGGKCIKF